MTIGASYRAIDATNTKIHLHKPAARTVCLTATGIDILAELNLEPIGYLSGGIANRPEFYGDRAQQFTSVGSWMLPNLKIIHTLQPDLILGWGFPHRFYQRWLRQIAPTYLMSGSGYNRSHPTESDPVALFLKMSAQWVMGQQLPWFQRLSNLSDLDDLTLDRQHPLSCH